MRIHRVDIAVSTDQEHQVVDITDEVRRAVVSSGVREGQCLVFTPHATAAIAINENADPNIGRDLQSALAKLVPDRAGWLHDRIDDNAAAHIKASIVGPSETMVVTGGDILLGTWQNVFLCEFDGPRRGRRVVVSVIGEG